LLADFVHFNVEHSPVRFANENQSPCGLYLAFPLNAESRGVHF
jgi:hypothetical protein